MTCAPTPEVHACTSATVLAAPPPKTTHRPPSSAPAASWTARARDPTRVTVPEPGVSRHTVDVDVSPVASPPSTTTSLSETRATARDTGAPSCHGAVVASTRSAGVVVEVVVAGDGLPPQAASSADTVRTMPTTATREPGRWRTCRFTVIPPAGRGRGDR